MTQQKLYKGFTLIELMVVMALMAVLAVLVLGAVQLARNTSTETIHRSNAKAVQTALESNFAKNKRYCGTSATSPTVQTGELNCANTYNLAGAYAQMANDKLVNLGASTGTTSTAYCNNGATAPTQSGTPLWYSGGYIDRSTGLYTELGGGSVTLSANGYYIKVVDSGCTMFNNGDDIKTSNAPTAPTLN